jgi:hypothetical protein
VIGAVSSHWWGMFLLGRVVSRVEHVCVGSCFVTSGACLCEVVLCH